MKYCKSLHVKKFSSQQKRRKVNNDSPSQGSSGEVLSPHNLYYGAFVFAESQYKLLVCFIRSLATE